MQHCAKTLFVRRCAQLALAALAGILIVACGAPAAESGETAGPAVPANSATPDYTGNPVAKTNLSYTIEYVVTPNPEAGGANVEMIVRQDSALLR